MVHLTELEEDQQVVNDAIPSLSVEGLHAFCCRLSWDDGLQLLMTALDQPDCVMLSMTYGSRFRLRLSIKWQTGLDTFRFAPSRVIL